MKTKNFLLFCIATNMILIPSANALKAEGFLTQQTSPDSLSNTSAASGRGFSSISG